MRILKAIGGGLVTAVVILWVAWSAAAVYFDLPAAAPIRTTLATLWIALSLWLWFTAGYKRRAIVLGLLLLITTGWLSIPPSNGREWQPDVAQLPWADVQGDLVTLHNFRNCEYRTETDYTPVWGIKQVRLSDLRGVDAFINYWGSPYICHPMMSFQFGDDDHVLMSIETRKEVGESYSAIRGFFRQYELIYLTGSERDFVRVRTNYRVGEDVYLFRLELPVQTVRERFLEYCRRMNELAGKPEWYNAVTANCTTSIYTQRPEQRRAPFDWRLLVNGKLEDLLYQRRVLDQNIPLSQLREQGHINERAKAANESPEFSKLIRAGVPGM